MDSARSMEERLNIVWLSPTFLLQCQCQSTSALQYWSNKKSFLSQTTPEVIIQYTNQCQYCNQFCFFFFNTNHIMVKYIWRQGGESVCIKKLTFPPYQSCARHTISTRLKLKQFPPLFCCLTNLKTLSLVIMTLKLQTQVLQADIMVV